MVYMSELLIVGCGGLGRMVGEVALATGKWSGVRFLDDAVRGDAVVGKCVDYTELTGSYTDAVAAFWGKPPAPCLDGKAAGRGLPSAQRRAPHGHCQPPRRGWARAALCFRAPLEHGGPAGPRLPCECGRTGGP